MIVRDISDRFAVFPVNYPGADWFQKKNTPPLPAPPPPPNPPLPPPPAKPPPPQLACTAWAAAKGWKATGCDANGTNCVLDISVTNSSGARVSHNVLPFVPPKAMLVPQADVVAAVKLVDGKPAIELSTNATALFVVLTTKANGRFSDNAFLLEKTAQPTQVFFEPWDDAADAVATAMSDLKASLRVEHLEENLVKPLPPSPPPPPLVPCPAAGCVDCGGCHWPYVNNSVPAPSLPFTGEVLNTTLAW